MELHSNLKPARRLDFSRPTFNEPNIQYPQNNKVSATTRLPSTFADDEESSNDFETTQHPVKEKLTENINVYLRLRPTKDICSIYKFNDNTVIIPQVSQQNQTASTEKHYTFSSVLNDNIKQMEIYDEIVRPTLSNFDIRGCTFTSYGVSSSGKTFTILGDVSPGLVPRAITQIFTEYDPVIAPYPCVKIMNDQISILSDESVEYEIGLVNEFVSESCKLNKGKAPKMWFPSEIKDEHSFQVKNNVDINRLYIWISFVEIYNEKINDLLNTQRNTATRQLKIFSNGGNSYIHGATWFYASNLETAFNILRQGLNKIRYAATGINDHSSRSHTILTINMIAESGIDYKFSSFKFCDLAGAERMKKTGNIGDRLKEAGGINNSLLVLGRCLEAIQQNQSKVNKKHPDQVVPVRDSKLTFLLQSSLTGHEKFVMIVNLYPTVDFFEENLNVLKFGSIANQIVVKKSEVRTFKRQSSRYSYLLNHPSMLNNSLKNESINGTFFEENDESALEDSFRWCSMSNQQLINELRVQKKFIEELGKKYAESEKEHAENRKQILEAQRLVQERIVERNEADVKIQKEYYEKKMKNQEIRHQRLLLEAHDEIEYLEKQLKKFKVENDSEDADEWESDDDVIELDD